MLGGMRMGGGSGHFLGLVQTPSLFLKHHGNAIADGKCQSVGLADQFSRLLAINQRAFAQRAYEYFKQLGIHVDLSKRSTARFLAPPPPRRQPPETRHRVEGKRRI
jgi:hypothetical protein